MTEGDAPNRSTTGNKNFYAERGKFCEAILTCNPLTPADRLAYYGIAMRTDPATARCAEGQAEIGRMIGLSRRTMTRAIDSLALSKVLEIKSDEGREDILAILNPIMTFKSADHGQHPGHYPGHGRVDPQANSKVCAAISETTVAIPYSKRNTAPFDRTVRAEVFETDHGEICDLVADYGNGIMDIGGVLACGEFFERMLSIEHVLAAVRDGALQRVNRDGTPNRNGRSVAVTNTHDEIPTRRAA